LQTRKSVASEGVPVINPVSDGFGGLRIVKLVIFILMRFDK
jgi:hypothetical protein